MSEHVRAGKPRDFPLRGFPGRQLRHAPSRTHAQRHVQTHAQTHSPSQTCSSRFSPEPEQDQPQSRSKPGPDPVQNQPGSTSLHEPPRTSPGEPGNSACVRFLSSFE
ncbi:hypothetical protein WMY93_011144 [Mugilogobius chulae]|uniref:Uncharacterized protein n=1 Tax=Mugilogobius chulae TaxID=88201 RepID=A0AAW0PDW4_9GOBI